MDVFRVKEGDYDAKLKLHRNLCHENTFLSPQFMFEAWKSLTDEDKNRLKVSQFSNQKVAKLQNSSLNFQEYLPNLPEEDPRSNAEFQNETLGLLFSGANFKFSSPVSQLKMRLINGKLNPLTARKKEVVEQYRVKKHKLTMVTHHFASLSEAKINHENILSLSAHEKIKRLSRHAAKRLKTMNLDERVGKRYITELRRIRLEVQEKGDSSDDEDYIGQLMSERNRKMSRLKSLQDWQQNYKSIPHTAQMPRNGNSNLLLQQLQAAPKSEEIMEEKLSFEAEHLPDLPALEEINKSNNLVTLEERQVTDEPESSFFALLKFCFGQAENRLSIRNLMEKVAQWEIHANKQLVTWMENANSWAKLVPSAVAFLCGAFSSATPPGFNPIIVCDSGTGKSNIVSC